MIKNTKVHITSGFTVIELAIVIIIVGIMMIPAILLYEQSLYAKRLRHTQESVALTTSEISRYSSLTAFYPCPSDRSLNKNDPLYGRRFDGKAASDTCDISLLGLSPGQCTPSGGICLVPGARDANGDGTPDPVIIGGVPYLTMAEQDRKVIESSIITDGWGSQLTYAVSANLTTRRNDSETLNNGVINAIDEHGHNTAGINANGHYTIISHGPDRKGAFDANGVRAVACAAAGTSNDWENCDDTNATFVQSISMTRASNNNYYDDYIIFARSTSNMLWDFYRNPDGTVTTDIMNLNSGNIGINTDNPEQKIDVNGDLTLRHNDPPNPTARPNRYGSVLTNEICNRDGTNCMDIRSLILAGTHQRIKCNTYNHVMRGIEQNEEICVNPVYVQPLPNQDCGTKWIRGFNSDGEVICTD